MLEYPVYVRMPTENERPYFNNQSSAEAVISSVIEAQMQGWLRLHGFVVMPNALEMIASPIRQGISGMVAHIQAETIPLLTVLQPNAGLVWSQRYTSIPLMSQRALDARLNMMLLGLIANGITEDVEAYPYSSANPRYSPHVSLFAGFVRLLPRDEIHEERLNDTHPGEGKPALIDHAERG